MTPSLKGWPTKAEEAPSPHEVRLSHWTPTQYFNVLGINLTNVFQFVSSYTTKKEYNIIISWHEHPCHFFLSLKWKPCPRFHVNNIYPSKDLSLNSLFKISINLKRANFEWRWLGQNLPRTNKKSQMPI